MSEANIHNSKPTESVALNSGAAESAAPKDKKARWADLFDEFEDLEFEVVQKSLIGAKIKAHLGKMSNREVKELLSELAAPFNLKVSPIINVEARVLQQAGSPSGNTSGLKQPKTQNRSSPEVKTIRTQIEILNKEIAKASKDLNGEKLPEDHKLVSDRNKLFRDLKEVQSRRPSSNGAATEALPPQPTNPPQ